MMMVTRWVVGAVGAFLMLGAFVLKGFHKGAFAFGQRQPDYPPTLTARIVLFIGGVVVMWFAVSGRV